MLNPKLIALNLLLAGAIGATGWQARLRWISLQAERKAALNVPVRATTPSPAPAAPKLSPPQAIQYADVAEKNLFAADRNPNVVVEPPKPVEVKKMPPLPVVYGTLGLPEGTQAIMAERPGLGSRSVVVGDTIGDFKVLALDARKVTFEWDGKPIEKRMEDLVDRADTQAAAARGPAAAAPAGPAMPPPPPPSAQQQTNANPSIGVHLTDTMSACKPGDNTPAGTVADGYKKVVSYGPFGATCRWMKQ